MGYEFTNEIRITCDGCGKTETVTEREFRGVIFTAERRGWWFSWIGKRKKGEVINQAFCSGPCRDRRRDRLKN